MADGPINVLFLCTGNSARSIIAEALLRALGGDRFAAFSAGSRPLGAVNPLALETLTGAGLPVAGLRSKGFEAFSGAAAPALDLVITVCDGAAREPCPVWPGAPATGHWSLPDPAAVTGTEVERRQAFAATLAAIRRRVEALVALPTSAAPAQYGAQVSAIDEAAASTTATETGHG